MTVPKCKVCKFWKSVDHSADEAPESAVFGECRRHAPSPVRERQVVADTQHWPIVQFDDWCGEFDKDLKKSAAVLNWESKSLHRAKKPRQPSKN